MSHELFTISGSESQKLELVVSNFNNHLRVTLITVEQWGQTCIEG